MSQAATRPDRDLVTFARAAELLEAREALVLAYAQEYTTATGEFAEDEDGRPLLTDVQVRTIRQARRTRQSSAMSIRDAIREVLAGRGAGELADADSNSGTGPRYEHPYPGPLTAGAYGSPIESTFAYFAAKFLARGVDFLRQVQIDTICGRFRPDFVVDLGDRQVGIELDGAKYHDPWRDEWRDAMLLGSEALDVIYRVRGKDAWAHVEDVLYAHAELEPDMFSAGGRQNLRNLASEGALDREIRPDERIWLTVEDLNLPGHRWTLEIQRTAREPLPGQVRQHWRRLWDFAVSVDGGNLDEVMGLYREDRRSGWTG